ncbi:helix-turn-helix domain-containing protein [Streptomyces alkaliterrae]|uniref:Helix-turn-helix domain-containing protein n=1 Tax=Streptomyces alkaliterrae TaxID=2213162 RepID=A0A5P0YNA2_9ACTN|nr:helix-turn-helix transcriptional regulator [Streptomyces alkaliterrae]MBB1252659.1 helix-turn-helix domain-containing protein [Streptomyces alkaliterrae]MBB1257998.1 helix-turn-helix domain-containing protein [Streptomyces alkaliterrae]MQS01400.1 helix-turn-helix domain-containing protein [Streptomyces alkaliterrae]
MSDQTELPADLTTGERIRLLRESRGMSRPVLAGLCGRGPDWLKKIEAGHRELRSHTLLLRLAAALQVSDLSVITGGPAEVVQPVPLGRLNHPAMPAIWAAVMNRSLSTRAGAEPADPATLQGRVNQTWKLWHASGRNRTEVGALLPDLIRDAEAAAGSLDGDARRAALVALSDVYRLTGQATAYVAPPELAWVVADRALTAAQQADQPAAIAAAAWNMGNILRETSYPDEALRVVVEAAELIRPHLDDAPHDWRGIYGALQLHAAVTAAREGREGDAWRYWDKGDQVAKSLPAAYVHPSTVFGRANVDFHEVSVATDLRAAGHALSLADEIDPDVMPSRERRARLWVEVARGHLQRGDRTAALHVMKIAHSIAHETVAYTPSARAVAADLWRKAPRALRPEASQLAEAVGVTATA